MNEKDLVLPMDRVPEVNELLGALKIKPTGLAARLMTNVYNQFFIWSTDLRDEYERYYCVEYSSFASYLELELAQSDRPRYRGTASDAGWSALPPQSSLRGPMGGSASGWS